MQALLRFDAHPSFYPSFRRRAGSRFGWLAVALLALTGGFLVPGSLCLAGSMAGSGDGIGNAESTATAGWDEPAAASWSFTRSLLIRRYDPTGTLLLSGKVLGGGRCRR